MKDASISAKQIGQTYKLYTYVKEISNFKLIIEYLLKDARISAKRVGLAYGPFI